jgi:hypothetical protein
MRAGDRRLRLTIPGMGGSPIRRIFPGLPAQWPFPSNGRIPAAKQRLSERQSTERPFIVVRMIFQTAVRAVVSNKQ